MFGRSFWLLALLGGAVAVPYVSTEWSKIKSKFTGGESEAGGGTSAQFASASRSTATAGKSGHTLAPLIPDPAAREETPVIDMAQAFRFDVTQPWVLSKWPRVTSGLSDEYLHGVRVPLITGTRNDDVAGALTYYFLPSQHCVKIAFTGTTGDPRRFTATLVKKFDFERSDSQEPGAEKYQIDYWGKVHSQLIVRPASVVRSSMPQSRYEIDLTLVDPSRR